MKEDVFIRLLLLVKNFEGFSAKIYYCPAGLATIGYGHVVAKHENLQQLTEAEGEEILICDLEKTIKQVQRLITAPLISNQLAALTSFTFNVGAGALQRSRLRQKLNRTEYEAAPDELRKWVWCQGKILPGLKLRREAEVALYSSL